MEITHFTCSALLKTPNEDGDYPIFLAGKNCSLSAFTTLLGCNECDVIVVNALTGNNTLHSACEDPDRDRAADKIRLLLMRDPILLTLRNKAGDSPLHLAAKYCTDQAVKAMLDCYEHCQLNAMQPDTDRTALHLAVLHNSDDVVMTFLGDIDIDVNVVDKRGDTAVLTAYRMKRYSLARTMERHRNYKRIFPRAHILSLKEVCFSNWFIFGKMSLSESTLVFRVRTLSMLNGARF